MSPFQPIGDEPRWRTLYGLLRPLAVDSVLTYPAMGEALGLDPDHERSVIQMAIRRAVKELETEDKHTVEVVPNVGYRIVHAEEHLRLAKHQQKRAGRALVRGHSKVVNVDFNDMPAEVRKSFEVVAQAFAMQMDYNRRFDVRQSRLESTIQSITERSDRSEAEIAALQARLDRLEGKDVAD